MEVTSGDSVLPLPVAVTCVGRGVLLEAPFLARSGCGLMDLGGRRSHRGFLLDGLCAGQPRPAIIESLQVRLPSAQRSARFLASCSNHPLRSYA